MAHGLWQMGRSRWAAADGLWRMGRGGWAMADGPRRVGYGGWAAADGLVSAAAFVVFLGLVLLDWQPRGKDKAEACR